MLGLLFTFVTTIPAAKHNLALIPATSKPDTLTKRKCNAMHFLKLYISQ